MAAKVAMNASIGWIKKGWSTVYRAIFWRTDLKTFSPTSCVTLFQTQNQVQEQSADAVSIASVY